MKTLRLFLFVFLLLSGIFSCAPELPADPRDPWLGSWTGTVTATSHIYGNNCTGGTSETSTSPFNGTLIITASPLDPSSIMLNCTLFKTEAVVAGTSGVIENTSSVTFDGNMTITTGQLMVKYRVNGSGNSCSVYGTSYSYFSPHLFEIKLTKK